MKPVCPRDGCHRREQCPDELRFMCEYEDGPDDLNEPQIINALERWRKEGAKARDDLTTCPYIGGTVQHYMHSQGWLQRDLQLGLCRADAGYRASQINGGTVKESDL